MLALLFECLASGVTADMQSWAVPRPPGMRGLGQFRERQEYLVSVSNDSYMFRLHYLPTPLTALVWSSVRNI